MPTDSHALPETLASHAEGLRRLVRGLVYTDAEAEDVVQETMLAAVQREGRPRNWGAWLTQVARNRASNLRREAGRRARRERRAARPESQPGPDELVTRLHEKRRLLDCLGRLHEPYRETLLLRYFEGLPPRAIALRRGVPVNTVKTHLQRGLLRLRADLDAAHDGERKRWHIALLPFAGAPGSRSAPTTALGWIAMNKITTTIVTLLLLAAIGWGVLRLGAEDTHAPGSGEAAIPGRLEGTGDTPKPDLAPHLAGREAAPDTPAPPAPDPQPATKANSIHGRVVDLAGKPVPGIRVTAQVGTRPAEPAPLDLSTLTAHTDSDGTYLVGPLLTGEVTLKVAGKDLVAAARTVPAPGARVDFVVEPAQGLLVRVQAADGRPVQAALVVYTARGDVRGQDHHTTSARTDARGQAQVDGIVAGPGWLGISAPTLASRRTAIDVGALREGTLQVITLATRPHISGTIVDKRTGQPIAGAHVSAGNGRDGTQTLTDASGNFRVQVGATPGGRAIVRAQAQGYRVASKRVRVSPEMDAAGTVRIELEAADPWRGVVRTHGGKLVAEAAVKNLSMWILHGLETTTNATGGFELHAPPDRRSTRTSATGEVTRGPHRAVLLSAWKPGFGRGVVRVTPDEKSGQIEIRLSGVGQVTGAVHRSDGAPAAGAIVRLIPSWSEARTPSSPEDRLQLLLWAEVTGYPQTVTNPDGTFHVQGVTAATYHVEARLGTDRIGVTSDVRVEAGGVSETEVGLSPDLVIRGRILDQRGQPVAGVSVFPIRGEIDVRPVVHSRADGSFIARGLTPGEYTLMLDGLGIKEGARPIVSAGAEDVIVRVERGVPFRGVVMHGGKPYTGTFMVQVVDAAVEAARPNAAPGPTVPRFVMRRQFQAATGAFTVRSVPPGEYVVRITTETGLASEHAHPLSLIPGVAPGNLKFVLPRD